MIFCSIKSLKPLLSHDISSIQILQQILHLKYIPWMPDIAFSTKTSFRHIWRNGPLCIAVFWAFDVLDVMPLFCRAWKCPIVGLLTRLQFLVALSIVVFEYVEDLVPFAFRCGPFPDCSGAIYGLDFLSGEGDEAPLFSTSSHAPFPLTLSSSSFRSHDHVCLDLMSKKNKKNE